MPIVKYDEGDFPSSRRWMFGGDSSVYRKHATLTANQVAEKISTGTPFTEALDLAAKARHQIALMMNTPTPEQFGVARGKRSATHLDVKNHGIWVAADRDLLQFLNGPLELDVEFPLPPVIPRVARQTYVETMKGHKILATRISKYLAQIKAGPYVFGVGAIVLEHTLPGNISVIMNDVLERLETIRKDPKREDAREQFLVSLYGYSQAMPFLRGSAAIGSVFFSGTYLALFGGKLAGLPPDPDLTAMTARDQKEYVAQLLEPTRLAAISRKTRG